MSDDLLVELLQQLDAPQGRIANLERRYNGTSALTFLAPEAKAALSNRLSRISSDLARLTVTSVSQRLKVTGFTGAELWDDWLRNDMDQLSTIAHREALAFGASYVLVWQGKSGPQVSIESSKQVSVLRDPGSREVIAAVKRWRDQLHGKAETHAMLYLPDRIEHWKANQAASTAGFILQETLDNPLGTPPVVQLKNSEMLLDDFGTSEIDSIATLLDSLHKLLADMMVSAEMAARPRRWATGIELVERPIVDENGEETGEVETVNPIPEGNRAMMSENDSAKFGQLPAADLAAYQNAVDVIMEQIRAASSLPHHITGVVTANPASADAIRSAEAGLTAKAESRAAVFGPAWEQVGRLIVAVRDGVDPAEVRCRVHWRDFGTKSEAQATDAAVKLHQAGVLSRAGTLERLGYTADEIEQELERAADAAVNEGSMAGLYGRRGTVRNMEALQMTNPDGSPVREL